ncbi:hypothetical protein LENED_006978 [Lentinula edodes]|uniref:HlyIII-domain-containing protein n=1 Tax=Lentinula edodes TaxID=5353 RepID=A0A1Q3ED65_LENED|nr:hypothetical protein LENED_006978 [Lentinula edodes]
MSLRRKIRTLQNEQKSETTVGGAGVIETPLLTWSELPEWMKDNEYIISGYRSNTGKVVSNLHNESVNIHSHLWGGALFLYFLTTAHSTHLVHYPIAWIDSVVISVFLVSATFCLCASAFFHVSTCHSEKIATHCHALDYSGIVVLTVGSFYPCIYYGFFCEPQFQALYITAITLVGIGAAYIVLNPEYAKPTHRGARTSVFIALGLCAVFPMSHWLIEHGFRTMLDMGLHYLAISGCFYVVGALLYANLVNDEAASIVNEF